MTGLYKKCLDPSMVLPGTGQPMLCERERGHATRHGAQEDGHWFEWGRASVVRKRHVLQLTLSPEALEMLRQLAKSAACSRSALVEQWIRKEDRLRGAPSPFGLTSKGPAWGLAPAVRLKRAYGARASLLLAAPQVLGSRR
jgi:hypothetical protein